MLEHPAHRSQSKKENDLSLEVSIDDIPQTLLEDIGQGVQHFFVPIIAISPEAPINAVKLIGSGTLVEIAGTHYVLTADHVWDETKNWKEIGLGLVANAAPLAIPRDAIVAKRHRAHGYSEWGPDLALLQIPQPLVAAIGARKSFLNLARQKAMLRAHPPKLDKALWAITGLVGEFSDVEPRSETGIVIANIQARAFFSVTCEEHDRDGYDFLDTSAKSTLPGVPSRFGGVSGGGLWQITLSMKKESGAIYWDQERHFRGVAFWQSIESEGRTAIRCHGPRSIFERAWKAWELPDNGAV